VISAIAIAVLFFVLYSGSDHNESSDGLDESSFDTSHSGDYSKAETSDVPSNNDDASALNSGEDTLESSEEASEESSEEPDHQMVVNGYGYTYLYYGAGYNQFNGTKNHAEKYASVINSFTSKVSFPVYSIIAPTSVEFVEIPREIKEMDDFYNQKQSSFISNVANSLVATNVDAYSLISEKVKDEYLYLRTDKNWTADGAYLAYYAFCTATGNIVAPKTMYEMGSYSGYLGNFYQATLSGKLKANADTVNFYKISDVYPCNVTRYSGGLATKDQALIYSQLSSPTTHAYYAFLGDRGEHFTISSQSSATEKTLLVIGDSSAFAFVPYLVANYRTVYFVNAEAFKGSLDDYVSDKDIDQAVFLSYATNAATSSYVTKLNNIITPNMTAEE
jgi:hypothetical protein